MWRQLTLAEAWERCTRRSCGGTGGPACGEATDQNTGKKTAGALQTGSVHPAVQPLGPLVGAEGLKLEADTKSTQASTGPCAVDEHTDEEKDEGTKNHCDAKANQEEEKLASEAEDKHVAETEMKDVEAKEEDEKGKRRRKKQKGKKPARDEPQTIHRTDAPAGIGNATWEKMQHLDANMPVGYDETFFDMMQRQIDVKEQVDGSDEGPVKAMMQCYLEHPRLIDDGITPLCKQIKTFIHHNRRQPGALKVLRTLPQEHALTVISEGALTGKDQEEELMSRYAAAKVTRSKDLG